MTIQNTRRVDYSEPAPWQQHSNIIDINTRRHLTQEQALAKIRWAKDQVAKHAMDTLLKPKLKDDDHWLSDTLNAVRRVLWGED